MTDAVAPLDLQAGFRLAMRRLTSTISIITTEVAGLRHGMAATAVQSLSADPPSLLICVNRSASIHAPLHERRRFVVNMLHSGHGPLVPLFSGKLKGDERFRHGDWTELEGLPMLADAQAALCCELETHLSYGSHAILIGKVLSLRVLPRVDPLLYQDGKLAQARTLD